MQGMARLAVLDELPACFVVRRGRRAALAVHADFAKDLEAIGYGLDSDAPLAPSTLAGRRPLYALEIGGARLLVRRFSHGGLLRWLTGARFLDPERPFRELLASAHLERLGVPTPQIVAARARAVAPFGWSLEVVSRHLEETLDLGYVLGLARAGQIDPRVRGRLVEAVGALVRRLHEGGFLHADLQPNNLLVPRAALSGGPVELAVIDLDRSLLVPRPSDAARRANIARLLRHVERRRREEGQVLSRTDLARFWRGYEPEDVRRRADWTAVAKRRAASELAHSLGWLLDRRSDPRARPAGSLPG